MAGSSRNKVYILRITEVNPSNLLKLWASLYTRLTNSSEAGSEPTPPFLSGTAGLKASFEIRESEVCLTLSGTSERTLEELSSFLVKLSHGCRNQLWRLSQDSLKLISSSSHEPLTNIGLSTSYSMDMILSFIRSTEPPVPSPERPTSSDKSGT